MTGESKNYFTGGVVLLFGGGSGGGSGGGGVWVVLLVSLREPLFKTNCKCTAGYQRGSYHFPQAWRDSYRRDCVTMIAWLSNRRRKTHTMAFDQRACTFNGDIKNEGEQDLHIEYTCCFASFFQL